MPEPSPSTHITHDLVIVVYPPRIPQELPADQVVVHNHVRSATKQGTRAFRYWVQVPDTRLERCICRWAPELPSHYRVVRRVETDLSDA